MHNSRSHRSAGSGSPIWLAALALLDGDPEIGKSLITIDLAARLSRGGELPNGVASGRPHTTILLGTEDNSAETIGPRIVAAGADLERVIVPEEEDAAGLSFPANIAELEELICGHAADLVVIDPIVSFLPSTLASTTDHGVRKSLKPLSALARRTDCTILLVRHLRKREGGRALYRGLGSVGFIAASRTGLFASRHPTDSSQSVLAVMKSNAAVRGQSLGYRIKSDEAGRAVVDWTGPADLARMRPIVRSTHPSRCATAPRPGSRLSWRPVRGRHPSSTRQPRRRAFPSGRSIGPRPSCTLARASAPQGSFGLVLVRLGRGLAEGYALQETGTGRVARTGFRLMAE